MSYCRFSSDDWRSDVYCWEDVAGGWRIEVAGKRYHPPPPRLTADIRTERDAWVAQYKAQSDAIEAAELLPIDGPSDGESLCAASPGEAADEMERLMSEGYHVPAGVVGWLREEQAEMDAAAVDIP